jgi:hypothetical protein
MQILLQSLLILSNLDFIKFVCLGVFPGIFIYCKQTLFIEVWNYRKFMNLACILTAYISDMLVSVIDNINIETLYLSDVKLITYHQNYNCTLYLLAIV